MLWTGKENKEKKIEKGIMMEIKEQPIKEQPIKEQPIKEQPIKEQPIKEQPITSSSSTDLVTRGLALLVEPIMQDISSLKQVDKRHAEDQYNFSNSISKHFQSIDQKMIKSEENSILFQSKIDEINRDMEKMRNRFKKIQEAYAEDEIQEQKG